MKKKNESLKKEMTRLKKERLGIEESKESNPVNLKKLEASVDYFVNPLLNSENKENIEEKKSCEEGEGKESKSMGELFVYHGICRRFGSKVENPEDWEFTRFFKKEDQIARFVEYLKDCNCCISEGEATKR